MKLQKWHTLKYLKSVREIEEYCWAVLDEFGRKKTIPADELRLIVWALRLHHPRMRWWLFKLHVKVTVRNIRKNRNEQRKSR